MQLEIQSPLVEVNLDTADGATSTILFYHKGYISDSGRKARWFAAQVTADNQLTITRVTDFKGQSVTTATRKRNFPVATLIRKTGTMTYLNRLSVNRHSNVIMQTSPTRQWVFYQFDWVNNDYVKCLILDIQPDSSSTINYLTRYGQHLYLRVVDGGGNWFIYYIDLSTHGKYGTVQTVTDSLSVTVDETELCAGEDFLYVIESGDLKLYTHGAGLSSPTTTYSSVLTETVMEIREIDNDDLFVRVSGTTLYRIEGGNVTTISTALESDTENFRVQIRGDVYLEAVNISRTPNTDDEHNDNWYITTEVGEINAYLTGIVQDICTDVGISAGSLDLTGLEGTIVQGFLLSNYSISDSFLKLLMLGYQFDRIESGGELKFVARGGSSSQTIDSDRLGALVIATQQGNRFPERIARTLEASRLIPKEVKVVYVEQQKDYDQTEQSLLRQDAQNRDQQILDMSPFAWTDSIARRLADKIIALYFSEREQFIITVSAYYYTMEPGDIITINLDGENTEIRVTETFYTFPGILQAQAVFHNVNDSTSEIDGIPNSTPAQSFQDTQEYETIMLDTNYLFDGDSDDSVAGVYAFTRTLGSSFNSPQIVRSPTGDFTWTTYGTISSEPKIGTCTTALGDGTVNIVDKTNSVTVQLKAGETLSSVSTKDFYNEVNMCAIGSEDEGYEILLFQTVVEIGSGDGTFQLSNFIRGIKGTEALTGTHAIGDTFVLIKSSELLNTRVPTNGIGSSFDYAAVDPGDFIGEDDDDIEIYRSTLANKRGLPFAVAQLKAEADSSNDIIITWIRRARYSGDWEDFVDVPETEITESYEVDIFSNGTVIRTLTVSTNTATYTAAQQTTDFGSTQSTVKLKVYKIHPTFGRGYEKEFNGSV